MRTRFWKAARNWLSAGLLLAVGGCSVLAVNIETVVVNNFGP